MNLTNFVVGLGFDVNKRQLDSSIGAIDQLASSAKGLSAVLAGGLGFGAVSTISSNLFKLQNISSDLGIGFDRLRALADSAEFTGGNMDSMVNALQTIKGLMETPVTQKGGLISSIAQVTGGVDINVTDMLFNAKSVESAFLNISDAVNKLDKTNQKNFLNRLGLTDMSTRLMLQKNRQEIEQLINKQADYSSNIERVVEQSINFEKSTHALQKNFRSMGETLTSALLPQLTSLTDIFTNLTGQFNNFLGDDLDKTSDNINLIATSLAALLGIKAIARKKTPPATSPTTSPTTKPNTNNEGKTPPSGTGTGKQNTSTEQLKKKQDKLIKKNTELDEKLKKQQERLEDKQSKKFKRQGSKASIKNQKMIDNIKKKMDDLQKQIDTNNKVLGQIGNQLNPKKIGVGKKIASNLGKALKFTAPVTIAASSLDLLLNPKSFEELTQEAKENPVGMAKQAAAEAGKIAFTTFGGELGAIGGATVLGLLSGGVLAPVGAMLGLLSGGSAGGMLGSYLFDKDDKSKDTKVPFLQQPHPEMKINNSATLNPSMFTHPSNIINYIGDNPDMNKIFPNTLSHSLQQDPKKETKVSVTVNLDGRQLGTAVKRVLEDEVSMALSFTPSTMVS